MSTPDAVKDYCSTIENPQRQFAYLMLDKKCRLVASGGELHRCGIRAIDPTVPVDVQIHALHGLLPITGQALVIHNIQPDNNLYLDMHLFVEGDFQWVVFVQNTEMGIKQQAKQQQRLSIEIEKAYKEKKQ